MTVLSCIEAPERAAARQAELQLCPGMDAVLRRSVVDVAQSSMWSAACAPLALNFTNGFHPGGGFHHRLVAGVGVSWAVSGCVLRRLSVV